MKMKLTSLFSGNVRSMVAAFAVAFAADGAFAQDVTLTPLSGTEGASASEGCSALVDARTATKWCVTNFNGAYIVFKASAAIQPTNYYLVTGGDTGRFPDRNWKTWRIYGANFASDADAVRESAEWTLLDQKVNADALLPNSNTTAADFTFSEAPTGKYTHFKIEVEKLVSIAEKPTMQMAEFNFGSSENIRIISYSPLTTKEQNRMDENEGPSRLLDANPKSKWGSGSMPNWLVFKTSSPILPTYYRLITGNDNAAYTGRNWANWEIYGANFNSDEEATNDAQGWVLIDKKQNIGTDVLPDKNTYSVYLTPSEKIAEPYRYFKLVIHNLQGAGYMQMGEFTWGDEKTFQDNKADLLLKYQEMNLNVIAQQSLLDAYKTKLNELAACPSVFELTPIVTALDELQGQINASANAYATYQSMVANVQKYLDEHPDMNAEGRAIIESYLKTRIEPNTQFTNGSLLYILETRLLNNEELVQEGAFITSLMEQYATNLTEGAINVTYEVVSATAGYNSNEDAGWMFDNNPDTKWCAPGNSGFCIIKTGEAVQPTFYKLVTGGDTGSNPSRNWKSWKLYAGNFESNEAATREAEGWVLIDNKQNVSKQELPVANNATAYFYLSEALTQNYQYFKLEIEELMDNGDRFQMAEMALFNQGNFYAMRQEFTELYETFDLNVAAQQSLLDEYAQTLRELRTATNVSTLGTATTRLAKLQTEITASVEKYAEYEAQTALLSQSIVDMGQNMSDFFTAYMEENVAPGDKFINGSYLYITENRQLSVDQLKKEITYLAQSIDAALNNGLVALQGTPGFNEKEGPSGMFDRNSDTKFGGSFRQDGVFVVFKAYDVVSPYFYALVTGGDTQRFPDRNWGTWKIYGANFAGDGQATREAEGWTLIDEKTDIGQNRLNPANKTTSYFGMSTGLVSYQYYKLEIESGYKGGHGQHQMAEFSFGSEEEFQNILADYVLQAGEFNTSVVAEQALLDQYLEAVTNLESAVEMEDLFAKNYAVLQLQEQINTSAQAYEDYRLKMESISQYLIDNPLDASDELTKLQTYLEGAYGEAAETYPNGVYATVYEDHKLSAEDIKAEIVYAQYLQRAAVAKGYRPGSDVTILLTNADLSQGWMGWNGVAYAYGTNGKMYAAEAAGNRTFDMNQTITGLKDGVYELAVNAGYRPYNNVTSTNYAAMIYANGVCNYVQNVIEDMMPKDQAIDHVNCHLTGDIPDRPVIDELGDTLGYVLHGVQSCCYAFNVGRYENKILAVVKDGKLTVGIKDLGTGQGHDWTGFGNFRLYYAGSLDEAGKALDDVLASQAARAATLLAYTPDVSEYGKYPNFGNDMRSVLTQASEAIATTTDGAGKYALVEQFSQAFQEIYSTKKAYFDMVSTAEKIYETWASNTAMKPQDKEAYLVFHETLWDGFATGEYTQQQAKDKKAELLRLYPPYLYLKIDKEPNSMVITEPEPFTYHIEGNGADAFANFTGLIETLKGHDYVIAFDYKMDQTLADGQMYFAAPNLNGAHNIRYGAMEAAAEWTPYYIDLRQAHAEWNWGNGTDHWLRWDMTEAESFVMDIRHIRIITRAEMEALGGTTAIEQVESTNKIPAHVIRGIFNLAGQKVQKPVKGLYIIDGKKVLVK